MSLLVRSSSPERQRLLPGMTEGGGRAEGDLYYEGSPSLAFLNFLAFQPTWNRDQLVRAEQSMIFYFKELECE